MFPMIDKQKTGVRLRRIMDKHGITAKDVQQYLGLGCVQSVYRWFNGQSMPTVDNLYALSVLLQVPIDALVCGNKYLYEPITDFVIYSQQDKRLRMYFEKLSKVDVA